MMKKTDSAKRNDGTVVINIYFIWSKSGTFDAADAKTVVSERAETLSPKYAPEIIAPAIQPSLKPIALPIPISATPIVAIVVHDEPVTNDTNAHIMQATPKKTFG